MKHILVTGGAGFVPSHLVDRLAENTDNFIVVLDNLLTGRQEYVAQKENIVFVQGDANKDADLAPLFEKYPFEYIFHYAAVVGVKRTLDNPLLVLEDIEGFRHLLEHARNAKVKRVFFSSSSEVYGESPSFPQHEEDTPLNSRLPYAIVKNVGEAFLRSYKQEHGLDYGIFRFFNTYGPRQSSDFVMSKFINAALKNEDITVYGDGSQTRTFCYVGDNIDATVRAFDEGLLMNDVANIGSAVEVPIAVLAETIIKATGSSSKIVHLPALEEGDMPRRMPDISKMKELLGRDFTPFEEGIAKTVAYFKEHPM